MPLRWGILGAARINRRFVPGVHEAGQEIAIIGARDPERARGASEEHRAERAGSYEDVLAAPDVDVVYVPLANRLHLPWTLRAIEAGKHVLCEKPLAPSAADCQTMVDAARARGVHLVEAFMYRYHPQWRRAREIVDAGTLGRIELLRATFQFPLHDTANVRLSRDLQGGALQDVGCYCVNVARWFLGEPNRVRGIAEDRQGVGVDTHDAAALAFPSGALALLSCSFETTGRQTVEIVGERGWIEVQTPFTPTGDTHLRIVDAAGERTETIPAANAYGLEAVAVEKLIRDGTPVLTPASDAAKTQEVIAAWKGQSGG